jgi:hypothetical protein
MSEANKPSPEADQFILEQIDSVPHLEALLLLWRTRPKTWPIDEMAKALYVPPELAATILRDLSLKSLVQETDAPLRVYQYISSEAQDRLMSEVDSTYRRELIRVSRMIHNKAPSSIREFARAFRFTKEKEKDKD